MHVFTESSIKTFVASDALAPHLRVKFTAGKMALAGSTDAEIGTVEARVFADLDDVAVRLRNAPGTCVMVAAAAFAVNVEVFAAANGKIDDSGTIAIGTALQAAGADGDYVEVLRYAN